ncbi:DUF3857 domain-containing protein [uncultured Polaribacter sp.]|uniref:DUF3857 domain-containing protein n=1 Tax=uncultured Polaribacter sp. TaxID=174711 RepID=UPI00259B1858|nr:DUF3857 domain-containing protein [uncultured Polaribacter sp.]
MKRILITLLLISQFSIVAQNYKFGKVSKQELEEKFYPLDSTADAAYLYRSRRTYFDFILSEGNFHVVNEYHERIKIYTKKGYELATKIIPYYSPSSGSKESVNNIKGYTFSLEKGKVVKEKLSKKSVFREKRNQYYSIKKIAMPNVKEGVVLEIKYKLISPRFWSVDDLKFQFNIPVKKIDYQIEIPEYYGFNKRSTGYFYVKMEEKSKTGTIGSDFTYVIDIFKFNADNIPAIRDDEPFVSSVRNYRAGLKLELRHIDMIGIGGDLKTYSTSWNNVSKSIYKSSKFGSELNKSNFYEKDIEQILAVAKTPAQKVGAIFQFVKKRVKWDGVYGLYTEKGVKKAYKERLGNVADVNLLLTSMLRSAGLNANPVLVSTRDNGVPLFPTMDGFNYVISIVEFRDGSYVLLDATEPYSLPNLLPVRDLNWNGRKIEKSGYSSWVKLGSSKPATEENTVMVKISEDKVVEGMMRTRYSNLKALNFRKRNNHKKDEDLITNLEENKNLEIEDFKIQNQDNIGKPIIRNIRFTSEDLIEEINGKLYLEPLLFLSEHQNPFKLEERKFPVDFATPWKDKHVVIISIPKGYKVESIPKSIAIGLPNSMGVFRFKVVQMGDNINTTASIEINRSIIGPKHYTALKDFYGQLVSKESEKIVLVKM